ncbi:MAG: type VI secretion system tube protein TssD [Crocinitomicaceae bacterium]
MSSFKAELELNGDGKPMDVIYTSTKFFRKAGPKGKPTTIVQGGEVEFRVEANQETRILEAMLVSQHKPISIALRYFQTEDEQIMRETTGEFGFITEYREHLDTQDGQQAQIYFKCRFQFLTVGGATLEQNWRNNA